MMTSIWYRPYFKIAIAIAIGNPASPIAVTTTSAAVVTRSPGLPADVHRHQHDDGAADRRGGREGDPLDLLAELAAS